MVIRGDLGSVLDMSRYSVRFSSKRIVSFGFSWELIC